MTGKQLADLVAKGCGKFVGPLLDRVKAAEDRADLAERALADLELRCSALERKLGA